MKRKRGRRDDRGGEGWGRGVLGGRSSKENEDKNIKILREDIE